MVSVPGLRCPPASSCLPALPAAAGRPQSCARSLCCRRTHSPDNAYAFPAGSRKQQRGRRPRAAPQPWTKLVWLLRTGPIATRPGPPPTASARHPGGSWPSQQQLAVACQRAAPGRAVGRGWWQLRTPPAANTGQQADRPPRLRGTGACPRLPSGRGCQGHLPGPFLAAPYLPVPATAPPTMQGRAGRRRLRGRGLPHGPLQRCRQASAAHP